MVRRVREKVIDVFAGGGGTSLGIKWATGRCPDDAINHDEAALAMHEANHADTKHWREDALKLNPHKVTQGKPVGFLWASPDCKHFSRAKGSTPVSKNIRSLAWIVVRWAKKWLPRVIMLENVREFAEWGPVLPLVKCKKCSWSGNAGQAKLARGKHRCGACNSICLKVSDRYIPDPDRKGVTFKQWVGRLKGLGYQVEWKNLDAADYGAPTHRKRLFLIARRDGAPIVWPEPTHAPPHKASGDIKPYRTAAECIDFSLPMNSIFDRKKPLAENTLRRIVLGLKRYVIECENPFIVRVEHGGDHFRGQSINKPLSTITAKNGYGIVDAKCVFVGKCHGQKAGESRCKPINEPLLTLDTQNRFALVSATILKHYGGVVGHAPDRPLGTITAVDHHSLMAANLIRMNHGGKQWNSVNEPLGTITAQGLKFGLVYAFLVKYYGTAIGQFLDDPLDTVTAKHRFGIVTVEVVPGTFEKAIAIHTPDGPYLIADIGLRMLTPRELARAQGFPEDYVLTGSQANQVARIGNSVCPIMAKVLVEANFVSELAVA